MLIIAGHLTVDPDRRDEYVGLHHDMVRRARATSGCLDCIVAADPVDAARVNLFERWDSGESLEHWRAVADPPATDIEVQSEAVEKYEISRAGPPF